jgi:hypothetical protein
MGKWIAILFFCVLFPNEPFYLTAGKNGIAPQHYV